jgi:hypothetical protein
VQWCARRPHQRELRCHCPSTVRTEHTSSRLRHVLQRAGREACASTPACHAVCHACVWVWCGVHTTPDNAVRAGPQSSQLWPIGSCSRPPCRRRRTHALRHLQLNVRWTARHVHVARGCPAPPPPGYFELSVRPSLIRTKWRQKAEEALATGADMAHDDRRVVSSDVCGGRDRHRERRGARVGEQS